MTPINQSQIEWQTLHAVIHCPYKAWLLAKESSVNSESLEQGYHNQFNLYSQERQLQVILTLDKITPKVKAALVAWSINQQSAEGQSIDSIQILYGVSSTQSTAFKISRYLKQGQKLLTDVQELISIPDPPAFYRNAHCPQCQFKDSCYQKLKERDCISLLGSITPKVLTKFHKKGISSITQLSHVFRPRRRRGRPQSTGSYLWELKALAIREQKTFVLHPPDLTESLCIIYLDFEGIPDEGWVYLIGGIIKEDGKQDKSFSFWADHKDQEDAIFQRLLTLLDEYPGTPVYHYGSYEAKTLRNAAKKYKGALKKELPQIEERMVNLLRYLRTHVYPPTYSNGLKELASFLGFEWQDKEATGLLSLSWRKQWAALRENSWKEKLLQYNLDDCRALIKVNQWLRQLASNAEQENVQQVDQMKKHSPFKFHSNPEYGEDFNIINRAAYFDYQHTKIYWRNKKRGTIGNTSIDFRRMHRPGKGKPHWQPKKANEIIIAPPLKKCKNCGHNKLYILGEKPHVFKQTDLKFTSSGIKRHIIEYRSGRVSCAKCARKQNNSTVRDLHYGDNLFAWALNMYVKYHLSNEMVSRMLTEQFGIWMNPMYLIQRKQKWWKKWKDEVAYIWEIIRQSPVIHIDDTSIRLSRDKGHVWVFATPHTIFYHFTFSRESDFLEEWLKDYKGVIVTDFFPGFELLKAKRQGCLVHLIRDLNDDLFKNQFDEEFKALVTAFGKLLRKIIETIDRYGLKKNHLQKHVKDTQRFFNEFLECEHKSELSVKYSKRLRKQWDILWTFLYHDDVPWNNNNAEAAIKAFAKHRRMVNGQMNERGIREHLEMLSIAQTCRYRKISFLGVLRKKVGMWEGIPQEALPEYLPFQQARLYARRLGLERKRQWVSHTKTEGIPDFIPASPHTVYLDKGWISWHDWLGFKFMSFEKARTYMRKLGLRNRDDYWAWQRSGKRPNTIPASPEKVYKHTGWKDLGDWLGTGNLGQQPKKKLSYKEAKAFVQALGIKTQKEFFEWRKSSQRPETIPSAPERAYYEFEGWGKFLGTDRIANQNRTYWSYEEAKVFLKPLHVSSLKHYRELHNLGIISRYIPRSPFAYYKKTEEWISIPDFFGKISIRSGNQ